MSNEFAFASTDAQKVAMDDFFKTDAGKAFLRFESAIGHSNQQEARDELIAAIMILQAQSDWPTGTVEDDIRAINKLLDRW